MIVDGTAQGDLANLQGQPLLDGADDGRPGSNYRRNANLAKPGLDAPARRFLIGKEPGVETEKIKMGRG